MLPHSGIALALALLGGALTGVLPAYGDGITGGGGGGGGGSSGGGGLTVLTSAGAGQFALAVSTNTSLTVPASSTCAEITVEGANIRRTSDGTSPTTVRGTLIVAGSQWMDCGPLAAYRFTAVSGSPTLDVEYFR